MKITALISCIFLSFFFFFWSLFSWYIESFGVTPEFLGLCWWLRQLRICMQCRRPVFDPWVGKISWRGEWLYTPVFLPGEFHGQRSLVGYSPWYHKEPDMTGWLSLTQSLWAFIYFLKILSDFFKLYSF